MYIIKKKLPQYTLSLLKNIISFANFCEKIVPGKVFNLLN